MFPRTSNIPESAPDALLRQADVAAEKFVAVIRMLVALALILAVKFAFSRGPMPDVGIVEARMGRGSSSASCS